MNFPNIIFLYFTHFSLQDVYSHLHTLSFPKDCVFIPLNHEDTNEIKNITPSNCLLLTDADFFLSEIPAFILSNMKVAHTYSSCKLPVPTLGIFNPETLPPLSTDFSKIPYIFETINGITIENISFVFCRFHQIPISILQTEQLLLREWGIQDEKAFFELYKSFPKSDRLACPVRSQEETLPFLSSYIHGAYEFYGHGLWAAIEKATQQIIGQCGIEYKERDGIARYELQYMISPKFQQKGFAFEISKAVCHYAIETLCISELYALIHPHNIRSKKLIEKLGFHLSGTQRIDNNSFLLYKICFPNHFSL